MGNDIHIGVAAYWGGGIRCGSVVPWHRTWVYHSERAQYRGVMNVEYDNLPINIYNCKHSINESLGIVSVWASWHRNITRRAKDKCVKKSFYLFWKLWQFQIEIH